jgi:hypothetical protein
VIDRKVRAFQTPAEKTTVVFCEHETGAVEFCADDFPAFLNAIVDRAL